MSENYGLPPKDPALIEIKRLRAERDAAFAERDDAIQTAQDNVAEVEKLRASVAGFDAAREMLNVQDNKIDALRSALRIARATIYSLDSGEIYDDELALIDAALAEGRS